MMVEFNVNNCDKEEAMKFVQLIAAKNDTEMKSTRHEKTFKGFVSQRFNWSLNMRKKNGKNVIKLENPPIVLLQTGF